MNAPVQHGAAVRTTCPYCGVGCGLLAEPDGRGGAVIVGDPEHPANFGRLCSKGSALGETIALEGRLLHPMMRSQDGRLVCAGWSDAIDTVADGFRRVLDRDGPNAVAVYLSGQFLTEDYYVANKLMKGFLGSPNVDTNSRLCMASSVAGHRRAFGADTVPGCYADLDAADVIVLVGSNAAWCHPVLFQRMLQNRAQRGARIVVIDPRRTVTGEEADLFLPIAPGTDTILFCGLLVHLAQTGALDRRFIDAHTSGFKSALARACEIAPDIARTACGTELGADDVARFFDLFRKNERVVTCYSQGVNQSAQGTDKVNAIINCHLATGRIGRFGMGPFSLTGQPNAMGGREVGGLANQLAAHMGFSPPEVDRVRRFWNAPAIAPREGLKAVQMFEAIERGEVRALWVMATNPAVSLPRAAAMRDALERLDLFVVSDTVRSNDTINAGAHVLLPAAAWGEKEGTVTNSERMISRQRAFLPLPGEAKPDWWIVAQVAKRLGFADAFDYRSAAGVFREHAALSAFENNGTRDFDLGGLAALSDAHYGALAPTQWPVRTGEPHRSQRFFADGEFFTPDRKARFVAPEAPALREATSAAYPLRLNTGRIRDQWHTMTRSGLSPRLATHLPEPFVEVHPDDARAVGLDDGGFAKVTTAHGAGIVKVVVSAGQRRGSLFMPIHWSAQTASCAGTGDLVAPQIDPHSGQPEAKATPAIISPVRFALNGFVRTYRLIDPPEGTWWTRVTLPGGVEFRLATNHGSMVWHDFAHRTFGGDVRFAEAIDGNSYCAAAFVDDVIDGCLCVALANTSARWDPLTFTVADIADPGALVMRASAQHPAAKAMVCSCFQVGIEEVRQFVRDGVVRSVEDIGHVLRAGTSCGSCLPELKRIIRGARMVDG